MKVFRTSIKNVQNATLRYGKDMYEKFTRISPTKFERMYRHDNDWVCSACGDFLNKDNEEKHRQCAFEVLDENQVANYIADMLSDDEGNTLQINEGYDNECYLTLS